MKYCYVVIDPNSKDRYSVSEVGTKCKTAIYVGNDFTKVVEAIQMLNADATFETEENKHEH